MPKKVKTRFQYFLVSINDIEYRHVKYTAEEIFSTMMEAGCWEMGPGAANKSRIRPGDKLVFYMSGSKRCHLTGTATVDSAPREILETDAILFGDRNLPFMRYRFRITDTIAWDEPKPVRPLLRKLSFVEPRLLNYWGLYFRQATRSLTLRDFRVLAG